MLDLLREQKQSSKFYDDKINFLLGVTDKTENKINEKIFKFLFIKHNNRDFKYDQIRKQNQIWEYLNAI